MTTIALCALILGLGIGIAFGTLQHRALLKDQARVARRKSERRRFAVPSSFRRIFYLVMALMAIQYAWPLFFANSGTQWVVTAGIIVGYGWTLVRRLRTHRSGHFGARTRPG